MEVDVAGKIIYFIWAISSMAMLNNQRVLHVYMYGNYI